MKHAYLSSLAAVGSALAFASCAPAPALDSLTDAAPVLETHADLLFAAYDDATWRTPPLWGIGLLAAVNRHELLLHDGRARGFAEAILWHGEGEAAREAFRAMSEPERAAVLRFLESL